MKNKKKESEIRMKIALRLYDELRLEEIIILEMDTVRDILRKHESYTPYSENVNSFYFWRLVENFWNLTHWTDAMELEREYLGEVVSETRNQELIDACLDLYSKFGRLFAYCFGHDGDIYEFYIMLDKNDDIILIFFRESL